MIKNLAGQTWSAQLTALDGSAVISGATSVKYVGDNGTYSAGTVDGGNGAGKAVHKGGGLWTYAPTAGETNFNYSIIAQFINAGGVAVSKEYPISISPEMCGVREIANATNTSANTIALTGTVVARVGNFIYIPNGAGTGYGQTVVISNYDPNTFTATVDPAFNPPPGATTVYWLLIGAALPTTYIPNVSGPGIRKNVALANFGFEMVDIVSKSPAPGKSVTVSRRIDGGSFGAGTLSAVTDLGGGAYSVDFAAADLNGDTILFKATASGCDDTLVTIVTDP